MRHVRSLEERTKSAISKATALEAQLEARKAVENAKKLMESAKKAVVKKKKKR